MNKLITNIKTIKINNLNLNFMKTTKFLLGALFCLTLITSCSNDDDNPPPVNEEELITSVTLTYTNTTNAMDTVVLQSIAQDGQDGTSTESIVGAFTSGATYALSLSILNATETPADDVLNDDIIPEVDEHFFTYAVNGLDLTMTRDADDNVRADGNKLGVNTTWTAGAISPSPGNVQIVLIHEPTTVDDSNEFGTVTGGEEDFNITFTGVEIQ